MKIEKIKEIIDNFIDAGNTPVSFYITYNETDNITSQKWGKIYDLSTVLEEVSKSEACIQGELPVKRLIIYSKNNLTSQCLVFAQNELWNSIDDESDDSHVVLTVPYIAEDGNFGYIVSERI